MLAPGIFLSSNYFLALITKLMKRHYGAKNILKTKATNPFCSASLIITNFSVYVLAMPHRDDPHWDERCRGQADWHRRESQEGIEEEAETAAGSRRILIHSCWKWFVE